MSPPPALRSSFPIDRGTYKGTACRSAVSVASTVDAHLSFVQLSLLIRINRRANKGKMCRSAVGMSSTCLSPIVHPTPPCSFLRIVALTKETDVEVQCSDLSMVPGFQTPLPYSLRLPACNKLQASRATRRPKSQPHIQPAKNKRTSPRYRVQIQ